MKLAVFAVAASIVATSAVAGEIGTTGLSINLDNEIAYDFDKEGMELVSTPSVGYSFGKIDFSAGMDIDVYKDDDFHVNESLEAPVLELGAEMAITNNITAFGEADWNVGDKHAAGTDTISGARAGLVLSF